MTVSICCCFEFLCVFLFLLFRSDAPHIEDHIDGENPWGMNHHCVTLKNSRWRSQQWIRCPPDRYDIAHHIQRFFFCLPSCRNLIKSIVKEHLKGEFVAHELDVGNVYKMVNVLFFVAKCTQWIMLPRRLLTTENLVRKLSSFFFNV